MSKTKYEKALRFYNKGEFDKSLSICDEIICENLKNSSALNLKGIIWYIKGNLKEAEYCWNINVEYNNDLMAKGYLKDLKIDRNRLKAYDDTLPLIKEGKFSEAIENLIFCSETDFNGINVGNGLAFCYMKKGELIKAKECIEKVLSLNPKDDVALKTLKEINHLGNSNKINYKKIMKFSSIGLGIIISAGIIYFSVNSYKNKIHNIKAKEQIAEEEKLVTEENNNENKEDISTKEESKKEDTKTLNINKLLEYINNKNYDEINNILLEFKDKETSVDDKIVLDQAKKLMDDTGVEAIYKKGVDNLKEKNYKNAIDNFSTALLYSDNSYLKGHIIYMLGNCYENSDNFKEALKYYERYIKEYPGKEYYSEVLYKLAVLYENVDINKSKDYGEKIKDKYRNSMYYNDVIRSILKK